VIGNTGEPPGAAYDGVMATQSGAASPLTFDVSRLARRPGFMQQIRETVPSPSRIGLDMIAIDRGAPLDLHLRLESVSEGVLVSGTVRAPTSGQCARCLGSTSGEVEIHLTELFAYPDSVTEATTERDEVGHIVNGAIDIEQPLIDAVGLELPLSPVCRDDCPGLCTVCGVVLADAEPEHHHEQADPRWAKLSGMFSDRTRESP
jgi:uncharacterized protein